MAVTPYFVFGPNTLLSVFGRLRGPDRTKPTPTEDWRQARVDVVIPALNEERTIVPCLASVARQTVQPRVIMLIDDGSTDRTVEYAKRFAEVHHLPLVIIRRQSPIGKTPTIKRQARELDSDVEFILDGDTILESDNYIERTVQELYQAVGIASACGTIMPLRARDRRAAADLPSVRAFRDLTGSTGVAESQAWWKRCSRGITNVYREVLYLYLQRFIYRGQMVTHGSITNPVGCAVAYRRKYVKDLFDHFGPVLGDNLTNSEDIFIGMALLNQGYRNIQLHDVYARTVEPEFHLLHRQLYMWSSAFLQGCYYFDDLLRSPLRAIRRAGKRVRTRPQGGAKWRVSAPVSALTPAGGPAYGAPLFVPVRVKTESSPSAPLASVATVLEEPPRLGGSGASGASGIERRVIAEPYRQPFGRTHTQQYGRPMGWVLLMSAIEKVFFPTSLLIMLLLAHWEALAVTVVAESALGLLALMAVTKGQRVEYLAKGVAVVPIRYLMLVFELRTLARFATDLWIFGDRRWRK